MKKYIVILCHILFFSVFNTSFAATKNVIIIETMPVKVITEHTQAIIEYFQMLNIKDINVKVLKADGNKDKAVSLLKDAIAEQKPDAVISLATLASQATYSVLKDTGIPMIFAVVADPIGAGIIEKENKPTGTNVTGRIYSMFRNVKIEMLMRILDAKKTIRFGVIHSDYPSSVGDLKGVKMACASYGNIEFVTYEIPYVSDSQQFDKMFAQVKDGVKALEDKIDYWWYVSGPLAETDEYHHIIMSNSKKMVAMGHRVDNVKEGAMMAISPDFAASGREVAKLTLEVLDGKPVGTIPVTTPANFTLSVNLSQIVKHGFTLPSDMLKLAGKNVYR